MDTGNHRGARQGCSRHAGGQRGTQGSSIGGTNSLSRESNTERTNKALSGIKLISSWIGKVWQCLGGCGRPLWLELEHPQKSTSPLGSSGKHGSAPADSPCSSLGSADGATPPSVCCSTTSSPKFPWRRKPRCSLRRGSLPRTPEGAPWMGDPH